MANRLNKLPKWYEIGKIKIGWKDKKKLKNG